MFRHGKYILYLSIFIVSLCPLFAKAGKSNTSGQDEVSIKLKWYHQFQFAGYYAADIKGFYKDAGLKVKLIEGTEKSPPVSYILKDSAAYGVTASDLIDFRINNQPVVVIAVIFQHSPYILVALKDRHISNPGDLIHKRIMIDKEQGKAQLHAMFLREGIKTDSIKFIPHTWKNQDLIDGKADAISAYITAEPFQLKQMGYQPVIIRPINYGIDFYGDMLFTSQQEIDKNPGRVDAVKKASLRGWEYAMDHPEEIVDYILTLPGVKERGLTKAHLMYEAEEMRKLISPELIQIGHINPGRFEQMLNTYKELRLAPVTASLNGFIYEEDKAHKREYFEYFLYFISATTIIGFVILFWNWQLRNLVNAKTLELRKENQHRRAAEERVLKSEARLELALQAAQLGLWDSDLIEGKVYRNERWPEMLGYSPDEIEPNHAGWDKLVHPEDRARVQESINNHLAGKTLFDNYEHRLKTKSGEWKWILSLSKIVSHNKQGTPTRIIGIHIDIDEIKQKEIELSNITKELLASNSELEKFAYITSHNLRAPVVNIASLIEMVNKDSIVNPMNREIFDKIQQSVNRLSETLSDLIDVISIRKEIVVNKSLIDIKQVFNNVLANLETQIKESGVQIEHSFNAPTILLTRELLGSILQNLITNALKYRSLNKPAYVKIKTEDTGKFIHLQITDNGLGIDLKRFGTKIFGLYQRFHTHIEGKGLGLYIIRSQIESQGGTIDVESEPNKGTVFNIYFPKK